LKEENKNLKIKIENMEINLKNHFLLNEENEKNIEKLNLTNQLLNEEIIVLKEKLQKNSIELFKSDQNYVLNESDKKRKVNEDLNNSLDKSKKQKTNISNIQNFDDDDDDQSYIPDDISTNDDNTSVLDGSINTSNLDDTSNINEKTPVKSNNVSKTTTPKKDHTNLNTIRMEFKKRKIPCPSIEEVKKKDKTVKNQNDYLDHLSHFLKK
jgi:hypothetical protein